MTWIPAPTTRAAVCIVDTGVDPNPGTTNVIARLAVDDGDPGDVDTIAHHGTLMSMIASAPYNSFGMVGAAPSVKVVSVRAKLPGENGFYFSDVLYVSRTCKQSRLTYSVKVISLSLGGQGLLIHELRVRADSRGRRAAAVRPGRYPPAAEVRSRIAATGSAAGTPGTPWPAPHTPSRRFNRS